MVPKGHHEIARTCVPILMVSRPFDDYAFFYLGNWFTDVSQAIAPVDYAAAMFGVLQTGRASTSWPDALADSTIDKYVVELLGNPAPRGSKMAAYFRDVIYVVGWGEFCRDPRRAKGDEVLLHFDEYDRIFQQRLTQYFPHEHLDRWPMDRTGGSRLGRRIHDYLEQDLVYVAELLTKVERDWAKLPDGPDAKGNPARHDVLLEFGHAVHAVEDYFAHSNYTEFAIKSLDPRRFDGDPGQKRRFEARLTREEPPRTDTFDKAGRPIPPGKGVPATDVVTGYFDSIDTRFSIDGVYGHLIEKLKAFPDGDRVINLLDYRGKGLEGEKKKTFRQSKEAEYSKWHDRTAMPQKVRDAHFRFMRLDWDMMDRWGGNGVSFAMENLIREGEAFKTKEFLLPDGTRVPYAERLGSHTLLAKDAPDKTPGYDEAMKLAKQVGKYIAKVMVRDGPRVVFGAKNDPNKLVIGTWVDWLKLLRYFCGHPDEAKPIDDKAAEATHWWTGTLSGAETETGHMLEYIDKALVDERAALPARRRLETEHNSMIAIEVAKYRGRLGATFESTTRTRQTLKRGEKHVYRHDMANEGAVRIGCSAGEVRAELSMILMDSTRPYTTGRAGADETWSSDFPALSSQDYHLPQSNITTVIGVAEESTYDIEMVSVSAMRR